MVHKPNPLNKDYNRDPNLKALERKGLLDQGPQYSGALGYLGIALRDVHQKIAAGIVKRFSVQGLEFRV